MTPENPDEVPPVDPEMAAIIFGDFESALGLWEGVAAQVGADHAREGEFSRRAARAFAEGLIFDGSVDGARRRMRSDRQGAVSFYEVAHEARDLLCARRHGLPVEDWQFVHRSDGRHEPFLLLASAVLNRLDWWEENWPEDEEDPD